jgi:hypothetical protein
MLAMRDAMTNLNGQVLAGPRYHWSVGWASRNERVAAAQAHAVQP